jgi:hypothetical protein
LTGWDDISSLKEKLQIHPIFGNPDLVMLLACHGSMETFEQVIYNVFLLMTTHASVVCIVE